VFGGGSVGVSGGWRPRHEDGAGPGFGYFPWYPSPQQDGDSPLFTPFMALSASAFPASETYSEVRANAPLFLTDLMRAVGIYEFNMRVIAGTLANQGSVINRYG
jgi:hypothetical protein